MLFNELLGLGGSHGVAMFAAGSRQQQLGPVRSQLYCQHGRHPGPAAAAAAACCAARQVSTSMFAGGQRLAEVVDFNNSLPNTAKMGIVVGAFYRVVGNTTEAATSACMLQFPVH